MIRRYCRMRRLPTRGMTRTTLAARGKGLQIGVVSRYQAAAAGVMTVGAVGNMCRCIDKCIRMTAGAVIRTRSRY